MGGGSLWCGPPSAVPPSRPLFAWRAEPQLALTEKLLKVKVAGTPLVETSSAP
jgi:hypothetical protein